VALTRELGLPDYRADQLRYWIYEKWATHLSEITVLPKDLRETLGRNWYLSSLDLLERRRSQDGTEKFLWAADDGETVESVFIPAEKRRTLCISSQAGCAMGCRFCHTAAIGLRRNLSAPEILNQLIEVGRRIRPARITHVVYMGMGEPLRNLDAVIPSLERVTSPRGLGMSKRRVTVSTSGYVPGIERLGREAPAVNLAVSLNAASDRVRDRLMPINRTYPLESLLSACRNFPLAPRRRITFEYVLISGINDRIEDARRLPGLLRGIPCKLNLIPINTAPDETLRPPPWERVLAFQEVLASAGMTATVRQSRGGDIEAACGQLRATREKGEG